MLKATICLDLRLLGYVKVSTQRTLIDIQIPLCDVARLVYSPKCRHLYTKLGTLGSRVRRLQRKLIKEEFLKFY